MKVIPYFEKLKDPRWQRKRLEIFERDEFSCMRCGSAESTLSVHHLRYIYGKEPWEYHNNDLITLCLDCHAHEQQLFPEVLDQLEEVLRIKMFFAADVDCLKDGLLSGMQFYPPSVITDMIEKIFRSPELVHAIFSALYPHQRESVKQ